MKKVDEPLFDVSDKFTCGKGVTAENVGELIKVLQQLPPSLPTNSSFRDGVKVEVFNINYDNVHVQINEND